MELGSVVAVVSCVENHDFCVMASTEPGNELHAEASEAVRVGNHNARDSAATDGVQKGEEAGALPVEARGDIRVDVVGVGLTEAEVVELAIEVGAPVARGDTDGEGDSSSGASRF